jgi:hypothetical protein
MMHSIRSSSPTLCLHARPATPGTAAVSTGATPPLQSPGSSSAPGPRRHDSTSGDRYMSSVAAAPALRDHPMSLSMNSAALSTRGAVA